MGSLDKTKARQEMILIQNLVTSGPEVFDFQVTGLQALIRAARRE